MTDFAQYADDVSDVLDSQYGVSCRWLANQFQIDVSTATQILQSYKDTHTDIGASFLISGKLKKNGGLSFMVTNEEDIESTVALFTKESVSQTIYSVQKGTSINHAQLLVTLDNEQTMGLLNMEHPNSHNFFTNSLGLITYKGVKVKPMGERILSSVVDNNVIVSEASKAVQSADFSSSSSSLKKAKPAAAKVSKASAAAVANFFGSSTSSSATSSASTSTKVKEEEKIDEEKDDVDGDEEKDTVDLVDIVDPVEPKDDEDAKVQKVADKDLEDSDDAEWDDGSSKPSKKTKKEATKKETVKKETVKKETTKKEKKETIKPVNKSIITLSDDEEEEEDLLDTNKKGKKGKKDILAHGAMDDYMEDVAIAAFKAEQEAQADGTTVGPVKRYKKKLIEKMFEDEKGYLVTEMVYEDVTDDEAPQAAAFRPNHFAAGSSSSGGDGNKKRTAEPSEEGKEKENKEGKEGKESKEDKDKEKASKKAKKTTEKAKPANSGGTQKSMMSFFAKKM